MSLPRVTRADLSTAPAKVVRLESGAVRVEGAVTRVGVLQYSDGARTWGELHLPEEIHAPASLATLPGIAVTDDHPTELVTPETWDAVAIGHVADSVGVEADTGLVVASLVVSSADALARVDSGELTEISAGYTCEVDPSPGVYQGTPYEAVQRGIRYNHIALGPAGWGRAGSDVRLRLNASAVEVRPLITKDHPMADKTRKDGGEMPPPADTKEPAMDPGAMRLVALESALADSLKENAKLKADMEAMKAAPPTEEQVPPMVADALAAKRIALVSDARAVLGREWKADGLSTADVHKAVVAKRFPSVKLDGLSPDALRGMALAAMTAARETADTTERTDALRDAHPGPGGATRSDAVDLSDLDPRAALDALTNTRFEREHNRRAAAVQE